MGLLSGLVKTVLPAVVNAIIPGAGNVVSAVVNAGQQLKSSSHGLSASVPELDELLSFLKEANLDLNQDGAINQADIDSFRGLRVTG